VVKDHVLALGSQVMAAQPGNTKLQCRLERLSCDWTQLITTLCDSETQLHAALMMLLPLQHVLSELITWLQSVEKTIREGSSKFLNSSADVQFEQQTYRVYSHVFIKVTNCDTLYLLFSVFETSTLVSSSNKRFVMPYNET